MRSFKFSFVLLVAMFAAISAFGQGTAVYNSIPNPLPPNIPSLGYQATSTAEWGDHVSFSGTHRRAASATVLMSNWARYSSYPSLSSAGFDHPVTFNIYAVDNSGANPAPGALLGSVTQTFLMPWRPEADPTCAGGTAWRAGDGNCYSGYAFTITFDLTSLGLTLPNEVIFGVAYNTNTWGYEPIGLPGPYESLNVGTSNVGGVGVPPSTGTDVDPDVTFANSRWPGFYTDGGAGGLGIFRRDTNWTGYSTAAKINAFTEATSANACKNGGWRGLARANGTPFRNQGDCIQYVNTGR
ncbi:MAG: hypothetical protein KA810_08440 [Pyrinomonadaceae bacterium]|nr:hypothetical protein [Pyrinomonadaceae bacterium]